MVRLAGAVIAEVGIKPVAIVVSISAKLLVPAQHPVVIKVVMESFPMALPLNKLPLT